LNTKANSGVIKPHHLQTLDGDSGGSSNANCASNRNPAATATAPVPNNNDQIKKMTSLFKGSYPVTQPHLR